MARTGTMRRPCVMRERWCYRWLLPSRRLRCLRLRPVRSNEVRPERRTCARSHNALRPCGQIRGHRLSFRLVLAWGTAHWLAVFSVVLTLLAFTMVLRLRTVITLLRGPPRSETFDQWVGSAAVAADVFACVVRRAALPVGAPAPAGAFIVEGACVWELTGIAFACRSFRCFRCFGCFRCFADGPYWLPGLLLLVLSRRCAATGQQGIVCFFCVCC